MLACHESGWVGPVRDQGKVDSSSFCPRSVYNVEATVKKEPNRATARGKAPHGFEGRNREGLRGGDDIDAKSFH